MNVLFDLITGWLDAISSLLSKQLSVLADATRLGTEFHVFTTLLTKLN